MGIRVYELGSRTNSLQCRVKDAELNVLVTGIHKQGIGSSGDFPIVSLHCLMGYIGSEN